MKKAVVLILTIVFFLYVVLASQHIQGVPPQDIALYSGTTFACKDGTATLSIDTINDDFCDCKDGSDEPGTSACNNGKFYCVNSGHIPQVIFSSHVNDGICDCCDGSDEYLYGNCQNVCKASWEQSTVLIRAELQEIQIGIDFTTQQQQKYESDVIQKKQELLVKEDKRNTLTSKIDELNSKKEIIQSLLESKTKELKESLLLTIEPEVQQQYEKKQQEILEQQQQQQQEQEQQEQEQQQQESQTEENTGTEYEHGHEEHMEDVDYSSERGEENIESVESVTPDESEEDKQKRIEEEQKESIRNEILDQKVEHDEQIIFVRGELTKIDEEVNNLNRDRSDLETVISELKRFIEFDFGDRGRYSYMDGASYTYTAPDYTYTLNPFKEVTQGHTRVGSWNSWEPDYMTMKYDNGERCWNGPDRSISVTFTCGKETQILEVKEPSKCLYSMLLKTPGACKQQRLNELMSTLNSNN
eukprot:TRINITY_DN2861_c0_g1_i1.p1 TRINITY_DN2861_c0_g1~~TRINITY_DN2861_c0_g1_i1.p1  ORF type:complete len:472 (-),score=125.61 TRINITY_DN2861_c0_g1_i1:156-1571(-)